MLFRKHPAPATAPALAALLVFALPPGLATAHDITGEILTDRSATCADHVAANSAKATDLHNSQEYDGAVTITTDGASCTITSNAVPNHDFNTSKGFANPFSVQDQSFTITANPRASDTPTPLSLMMDNAVFLNGVKLDQVAAGCFGVGDGFIGCNDMDTPYRFDPMGGASNFGTDAHNAHTQPDGTYHYHGNPMALFNQDTPDGPSPVIGFAADGFPIFGSYIDDDGEIRKATTSYHLKSGTRPDGPGGSYDGTYVDDWEYVAGSGDLDICNGMVQDGVYGYVVTEAYPHVLGCFTGTPDDSFRKRRPGRD
ncbi:YHYH protein [Pseudooceanicola algae]|uniref:YHYH domain-containing protein n=1 Tax=Pseudooceanicola algae TaxID=1537215 RepID=A0A418SK48_9RHOB|nr:YHYH protein [Pseudooceanicola algae]QPM89167.1 hypothetical protein PSAL_003780 [Pseudooceanicola algae]